MKLNSKKKIIGILLSSLLASVLTVNAFGSDLDTLLSETEGLEDYLHQLTTDMKTLSLEYELIQGQIDDVETHIASNEVLLADTQAACDTQYDLMKKRIVYLYESGDTNYLTALLSAQNLGDMLNKFEYINNIVGYDRDMLTKYNDLVDTVNTLQADLVAKKTELEDLRTLALDNMYKAASVSDTSETEILNYGVSEEEASEIIQAYMAENGDAIMEQLQQSFAVAQAEYPDYDPVADYGNIMDVVMSDVDLTGYDWSYAIQNPETQAAAETPAAVQEPATTAPAAEPATTAPAANNTQTTNSGSSQYDEAYLIAALVSGEAGYTSYETQVRIAQMVNNRIKSDIFPDNAYDVLHQSGQFNIWDENGNEIRTDTYFVENGPMETAMQATQDVLAMDSYDFPYMGAVTEDFYYSYPEYFTDTYGEVIDGGYYFNYNWW